MSRKGGEKFLFTKKWHVNRDDNKQKVWEAEQKERNRSKAEKERQAQLKKEREILDHRIAVHGGSAKLDAVRVRDRKTGKTSSGRSVSFLYEPPPGFVDMQKKEMEERERAEREAKAAAASSSGSSGSSGSGSLHQQQSLQDSRGDSKAVVPVDGDAADADPANDAHSKDKKMKAKPYLQQLEEKFPFLKNVPVKADWMRTLGKLQVKPLGIELRDVRCMRCNQYGHKSGDRECPMINSNPNDAFRQRLEDPMWALTVQKKRKLAAMSGAAAADGAGSAHAGAVTVVDSDDGGAVGDAAASADRKKEGSLVLKYKRDTDMPKSNGAEFERIESDDSDSSDSEIDISAEDQQFLDSLTEEEIKVLLKEYRRDEKRHKKKRRKKASKKRRKRSRSSSSSGSSSSSERDDHGSGKGARRKYSATAGGANGVSAMQSSSSYVKMESR